jgi:cytochrome c-type biogenesis protein CcmE
MNKRSKRKVMVIAVIFGVSLATVLGLTAFQDNLLYFYSPAEVVSGKAPSEHSFRVGGLVVAGSVKRAEESLDVSFDLTDNTETITVVYSGILPDLFREGQGIVAMGRLQPNGRFVAQEVLAKHDENYMPPEVADALKAAEEAAKAKMKPEKI